MPEPSIADKLRVWKEIVNGMRPHLTQELTHLQAEHAELEAIVQEVESLNTQEDTHTARLREITRNRREAAQRGAALKGRLQAGLQAEYGKRSPVLHEFGLRPLGLPARRRGEEATAPPPAPAAAAAGGT